MDTAMNMVNPGGSDQASQECRDKALRYYRHLAIFQFVLAAALLTSAGLAVSYTAGEHDGFGPPYFIGGFIAGALVLFGSVLSFKIHSKGAHFTESDTVKKEMACAMTLSLVLAMFTLPGCFIGLVMVGIGGMCGGFTCYYTGNFEENKTLAVAILVLLIITVGSVVCTVCIISVYGSYFGVIVRGRRRGHVTVVFNQGVEVPANRFNQQMGMFGQPAHIIPTTIGGQTNAAMVSELQRQNVLLQQHLQQLQHQQQPGYPPPPPNYGQATNTPMFPPAAPPPVYPGNT